MSTTQKDNQKKTKENAIVNVHSQLARCSAFYGTLVLAARTIGPATPFYPAVVHFTVSVLFAEESIPHAHSAALSVSYFLDSASPATSIVDQVILYAFESFTIAPVIFLHVSHIMISCNEVRKKHLEDFFISSNDDHPRRSKIRLRLFFDFFL